MIVAAGHCPFWTVLGLVVVVHDVGQSSPSDEAGTEITKTTAAGVLGSSRSMHQARFLGLHEIVVLSFDFWLQLAILIFCHLGVVEYHVFIHWHWVPDVGIGEVGVEEWRLILELRIGEAHVAHDLVLQLLYLLLHDCLFPWTQFCKFLANFTCSFVEIHSMVSDLGLLFLGVFSTLRMHHL